MRKLFIFLLMAMATVFVVQSLYAGDDIYNDGIWKEDSEGIWRPITTNYGGYRNTTEVAATNDTLTSADSGKTIIVNASSSEGAVFTLPAAKIGMEYSFISAKARSIKINPATTETIVYSTCLPGDQIVSTGSIGDSITIVCSLDGFWYVKSVNGTWNDGN